MRDWLGMSQRDQLWRVTDESQITGFGPDLQRVCRAFAIKLNALHKSSKFNGSLGDNESLLTNIIIHKVSDEYKVELKSHSEAASMNTYSGMLRDLNGFINLIRYIGNKHTPDDMKRPDEYDQFFELVDEFQSLLDRTDLDCSSFTSLRTAELWIYNFPAFLESCDKYHFIEKVWNIRKSHKPLFDEVQLSRERDWVKKILHPSYVEVAVKATDEVGGSIYDRNPTGRFQYIRSTFHHTKEKFADVANYFQDTLPYVFGEMYVALYKQLPKHDGEFLWNAAVLSPPTVFIGVCECPILNASDNPNGLNTLVID
ncbi:hypothetical protein COLO4_31607 [Corchorus olitorius]|uniref:Uncharacterized protein n=1 Tax=Corchorus olitorius TaxID=93759 RepID=A0A1R3H3U2_9ROSI|nr:hypothetical protein COLO4_31607 [Corchorus olitorius]